MRKKRKPPHNPLCSGFWFTVFYKMRALMAFAT